MSPAFVPLNSEPLEIAFSELAEFSRDVERLEKKRLRSLRKDIEVFKKALSTGPETMSGVVRISDLGEKVKARIFKAKKFRSRDLQTTDKLRVIFAWFPEKSRLTLIEIYPKSSQEKEDRERIFRNFS